ncbi:type IV pilus modification protein PilV [Azohydromonas sediminis]|uniref:type IV pilus modification protein PilV n=1 Tax=Azohydromonas sediminis TaxID=2259674 RepID=UPI000E65DA71|nr:type IV pilus modification protein PilV [Azohydromonas sediminis]
MSPSHRLRPQAGFMLIEVLIAVLVFSLGVLTIVGLQAASVQQSTKAKYRADATLLANDLVGRMWVTDRKFETLSENFATGGDGYGQWLANVAATLPGAADNPPEVTVESIEGGGTPPSEPSSLVTITLRWKPPQEPAGDPPHSLTVVTRIK